MGLLRMTFLNNVCNGQHLPHMKSYGKSRGLYGGLSSHSQVPTVFVILTKFCLYAILLCYLSDCQVCAKRAGNLLPPFQFFYLPFNKVNNI